MAAVVEIENYIGTDFLRHRTLAGFNAPVLVHNLGRRLIDVIKQIDVLDVYADCAAKAKVLRPRLNNAARIKLSHLHVVLLDLTDSWLQLPHISTPVWFHSSLGSARGTVIYELVQSVLRARPGS